MTTAGSPQTICFLCPPGTGAPAAATGGQQPVLRWCPVRLAPPPMKKRNPPRTRPASCRAMLARRWGYRRRDRVPPCDGILLVLSSCPAFLDPRQDATSSLLLSATAFAGVRRLTSHAVRPTGPEREKAERVLAT